MSIADDKDLLERAVLEIQQLRQANQIMGAKVEVMDLFALVLNTKPNYPSQGMTEDIAWKMQRRIDDMRQQIAAKGHS